jgi:hypothetical protein
MYKERPVRLRTAGTDLWDSAMELGSTVEAVKGWIAEQRGE